jgi:hypothetical protein
MDMKKFFLIIFLLVVVSFQSCTKEFTIIGKWGMISGTITNSDGSTDYYGSLGNGIYYQYLEFRQDGTLIRTALPDETIEYGVYTYNDADNSLSYKFNGQMYFSPATVNVLSNSEMNITTDYGSIGRITQYFEKI